VKLKKTILTSRYFYLQASSKSTILKEGTWVEYKNSKILEDWIDIYLDGIYLGTIPQQEFKINFRGNTI